MALAAKRSLRCSCQPRASRNPPLAQFPRGAPATRSRDRPPRRARGVAAQATPPGNGPQGSRERGAVLAASALVTTAIISALALTSLRESVVDYLFLESISSEGGGFGAGDVLGGALWGWALYFTTPVQLVLLFFGRVEAERPSDQVLRLLGKAANQPVDAVDYAAPGTIRAATALVFLLAGLSVAAALNLGLGDATWAVSSGLGACLASAVYELGRPQRLSVEEGMALEEAYRTFETFAQARLRVGSGRCHEREVFEAFRRSNPKLRDTISDALLRDMVRIYHPGVERTPRGFLRNLSLVAAGTQSQVVVAPPGGAGGGRALDPQQLLQGGLEEADPSGSQNGVVRVGAGQRPSNPREGSAHDE